MDRLLKCRAMDCDWLLSPELIPVCLAHVDSSVATRSQAGHFAHPAAR